MLLDSRTVHVPAGREVEADRNEFDGQIGTNTRAAFGRAAVEAGTVEGGGMQDVREDVVDAITNLMHYYAESLSGDKEWRDEQVKRMAHVAFQHYRNEAS
jgi:hypothetical protein